MTQPTDGTHTEHEDHPWTIDVGDHPTRTRSSTYNQAHSAMIAIVKTVQPWFYGDPPYQDHHGGGLWLKDEQGWFLVKNLAGVEWSAIPAGDPAKFEALRVNAKRLIAGFPLTLPGYKEAGLPDDHIALLDTPITTPGDISRWTDSIFNASIPLPAGAHTGVVKATGDVGGVHHYPVPITDIQFIKRDDFSLFVVNQKGEALAVVPTAAGRPGEAVPVTVLFHQGHPENDDGDITFTADSWAAKAAYGPEEEPQDGS